MQVVVVVVVVVWWHGSFLFVCAPLAFLYITTHDLPHIAFNHTGTHARTQNRVRKSHDGVGKSQQAAVGELR